MSEGQYIPDPPAPPPSIGARDEVRAIADWCEGQREHAEQMAGAQIRVVWTQLLGGLVLLLIPPRLLQEIDFAWQKDSLPPAVIDTAKATANSIERNRDEMAEELRVAIERRDAIMAARDVANETEMGQTAKVRDMWDAPFSVWRDLTDSAGAIDAIKHLEMPKAGDVIALGSVIAVGGKQPLVRSSPKRMAGLITTRHYRKIEQPVRGRGRIRRIDRDCRP